MINMMKAKENTPHPSNSHIGASTSAVNPNTTAPSDLSELPQQPTYGMPMNFFSGQQAKPGSELMVMPTYPNPIVSVPSLGVSVPNKTMPQCSTPPMPTSQILNTSNTPINSMPPPRALPTNLGEAMAGLREDIHRMFVESFGVEPKVRGRTYQKPYPSCFDAIAYPQGYKVPEFSKFNGEDSKTTWEHVSQYLAQLGEAGSTDELKVRLFPLSLTGTAFSWFSALSPGSITTWLQLEQKFHDHFYSGDNELKLSHLTSVRQKHDESVSDYVKRFRDVKNRCYSLVIGERDLADLVLNGFKTHIKEKLEGYEFLTVNQVLQRALAQESRSKDVKDSYKTKTDRPRMHVIDYNSGSDDEVDVYAAEFVWHNY
jgi:hypothetical protein